MTVETLLRHFEYNPDVINYEDITYERQSNYAFIDSPHRHEFLKTYGEYKVVEWHYDNSNPKDVLDLTIKR